MRFSGIKDVLSARMNANSMNLDETMRAVQNCAARMNAQYGTTVFDEWVVVSLAQPQASVLAYVGPRIQEFVKNFSSDLGSLRGELLGSRHQVGDFEFARHATGTQFEAFMNLGDGLYLFCNNTRSSMDEIAKNPKWLAAQVPFAELSEKITAKPLEMPV